MIRRLPPFPELVAFEAVARHLSFTRAAAELSLTQSAVSHRVRRLEKYFGVQLIRRLNPGLVLTAAGTALLPELMGVLDGLSNLSTRTGARRERRLRVAAGSALCTWWLAGRLASFMKLSPGISIELLPIENDTAAIPDADVRILWVGAGQDEPTATQAPLFSERVFPVCSPSLLPNRRPLAVRSELANLPLLHKMVHSTGEWSWQVWFERLGLDATKRRAELRFADMSLVMSAAVDGSGVALVRSLLAHDALRDGRLTVPVAGIDPMVSSKQHVARWRRDKIGDTDIDTFVAWLAAEAKATLVATDALLQASRLGPLAESA